MQHQQFKIYLKNIFVIAFQDDTDDSDDEDDEGSFVEEVSDVPGTSSTSTKEEAVKENVQDQDSSKKSADSEANEVEHLKLLFNVDYVLETP